MLVKGDHHEAAVDGQKQYYNQFCRVDEESFVIHVRPDRAALATSAAKHALRNASKGNEVFPENATQALGSGVVPILIIQTVKQYVFQEVKFLDLLL